MITLFCHIGWMMRYNGDTKNDRLRGGGSYVEDNKKGHEVCNFAKAGGRLYGSVQVGRSLNGKYNERRINFKRLGVPLEQDTIEGGTIVWTATDPDERGSKVIGWYRNATIHQQYKHFPKTPALHRKNGISGYWISAPSESCVLLPEKERTIDVPRMKPGFPGISPIWYADSQEGEQFVRQTLAFISSYSDSNTLAAKSTFQDVQLAKLSEALEGQAYFAAASIVDERIRLLCEVVQRRGQEQFRRQLLDAYGRRCAVTGCDAVEALEAAHIIDYMGSSTQDVRNGILLRADIHTLFDLRLLSICPDTLSVVLAPSLRSSSYATLHGQPLTLPVELGTHPDVRALRKRWRELT